MTDLVLRLEIESESPQRIDAALRDWFKITHNLAISREKIKRWIETIDIRVKERGIRLSAHDAIGPGPVALMLVPSTAVLDFIHEHARAHDASHRAWKNKNAALEPTVIDETSEWIAIDKPSGLPSVPLRADDAKLTAADYVRGLGRSAGEILSTLEAGAVHRLDTDTSGILLFAKTAAALRTLDHAWESPELHKIYRALTVPSSDAITLSQGLKLDQPIARDLKAPGRVRVITTAGDLRYARGDAMPALTEILRFKPHGNVFVEIEVRIRTGVQHQIRAHLAHAGFPIAGDVLYAPERACLQSKRLELYSIALGLPERGESRTGVRWIKLP